MNCSNGIKTLDVTLYKAAAMNAQMMFTRIYTQPRAQGSSHYARTLYMTFLLTAYDLVDLPALFYAYDSPWYCFIVIICPRTSERIHDCGIDQMSVLSSLCLEEGGIAVLGWSFYCQWVSLLWLGTFFKFVCKGQRKYMDLANPKKEVQIWQAIIFGPFVFLTTVTHHLSP